MVSLMARRGFTLIEMMIVVAVIAILAAVVIPSFFRESAKSRAISEVTPMFAEISNKLEQYKSETGKYTNATTLASGAGIVCPAQPYPHGGSAASSCLAGAWTDLRVNPVQTQLFCSYEIQVGDVGDAYVGALPAPITFTAPTTTAWWTILATCDGDNSSTLNASYFQSSVDATIQKANDGS